MPIWGRVEYPSKIGHVTKAVADPENSERGGQETWNISRRAQRPSFFGLFFTGQGGGGAMAPLAPPWIRYCKVMLTGANLTEKVVILDADFPGTWSHYKLSL